MDKRRSVRIRRIEKRLSRKSLPRVLMTLIVLLAEILVDGAVFAGLYRRVRRIEEKHWLPTAIRRTALPALFVAFFFGVAGYLMQRMMPDAHTIGEF